MSNSGSMIAKVFHIVPCLLAAIGEGFGNDREQERICEIWILPSDHVSRFEPHIR